MSLVQYLNQIAQERDLSVEELRHELDDALAVAYRKFAGATGDVSVRIDLETQDTFVAKEVVGEVLDPAIQISVVDARKRKPEAEVGDLVDVAVDKTRFGRIAATTLKQVLQQKIREAEHRKISETFSESIGELVNGQVSRREEGVIYIQVNRIECELPRREQVPTEHYRPNDRLKVYVLRVDDSDRRGMKVIVSRTHPNLLRKLFELEVPEIADNIIVIKGVAREPGQRSKVAVMTTDERVDPIGACVGPRGARVQAIVDELFDEKIDVVPYSDNPETFIINALSPAKVNSTKLNEEEKSAYVVVPDTQLSLAIGKGGQNVRLAARLTEWKIDIRSESQATAEAQGKHKDEAADAS